MTDAITASSTCAAAAGVAQPSLSSSATHILVVREEGSGNGGIGGGRSTRTALVASESAAAAAVTVNGTAAAVVVISTGSESTGHKGHYLCQECNEDTMAVLLRKALEKRTRRVRSKQMLDQQSSGDSQHLGVKSGSFRRPDAPTSASYVVETF